MELSFCDLKNKTIVNICDGKNMGNLIDMIFDSCSGRVVGIVVPCNRSFFGLFKSNNDIFIPYNRICKIGKDIILVDIIMQNNCENNCYTQSNIQNIPPQQINIKSILQNQNIEQK